MYIYYMYYIYMYIYSSQLAKTIDFIQLKRPFFGVRSQLLGQSNIKKKKKQRAETLYADSRDIKSAIITNLITRRLLYQLLFPELAFAIHSFDAKFSFTNYLARYNLLFG